MDHFTNSGAVISKCERFRYDLWRVWDEDLPLMVFVMLNPSTADAAADDPTIRRCIGFARREHFGGIRVRNVFAFRATDSGDLLRQPDPCGPLNEAYLREAHCAAKQTQMIVAWGARLGGKRLRRHYDNVSSILAIQNPHCLGATKSGDPRHPLYVRRDAELAAWRSRVVAIRE